MDIERRRDDEETQENAAETATSATATMATESSDQDAYKKMTNSLVSAAESLLPSFQIDLGKMLGFDGPIPIGAHSSHKKQGVHLTPIETEGLPHAYNQPAGTDMDGKCGITGVANMLRLYGIEKKPEDIDLPRYRSWGPGLRADKFADDLTELSGQKFNSKTIENGENPLEVLKQNIKDGKPVAIMYMTSPTEAHWVVVTDVKNGPNGPELTVQSGGRYNTVPFKDIQSNWQRGYGGPYPYVVGEGPSKFIKKQ